MDPADFWRIVAALVLVVTVAGFAILWIAHEPDPPA